MKLSIITVNLNNLEGLKKTYDSVVCQTFTDYEWLVIDGGSTDGSREFIEQHQDKFAYWCSEPDKGIYNAMNKGIVRAKGEYLNFMNSGDCFACEETVAEVFGKNRTADILYGYSFYGSRDGTCCTTRLMKPTINGTTYIQYPSLTNLLLYVELALTPWAYMMKNARLLQIGNGLSLPSYIRTLPMNLFHLSFQSVNMEVLVKQINVIWSLWNNENYYFLTSLRKRMRQLY